MVKESVDAHRKFTLKKMSQWNSIQGYPSVNDYLHSLGKQGIVTEIKGIENNFSIMDGYLVLSS